ncbi:MAG: inositol monophosphatase family protein [bacterium]|nr:inositol monophosphatase family protein [bacterium]
MDLKLICEQACITAREAGNFIREERKQFKNSAVEVKSFNQLVSYVDKSAEELLVQGLSKILPQAGFITEENTIATEQKEYMWIIDPLDGTTNFIHDIPVYSVSIGLLHQTRVVCGIVFEVNKDELFYAWKDGGAWLNGKQINVKTNTELGKSLLATGFPYCDYKQMDQYLNTLKYLMKNTQGMRRMGSAAIDLAYTACGRFDGFFEYGLSPWDVAGGICLIQEAGGIVTDFAGNSDCLFGKSIVGSSKALFPEFSHVIKENFGSNQ